jgi:cell division protein FtsI/penicillin-binding protein 2
MRRAATALLLLSSLAPAAPAATLRLPDGADARDRAVGEAARRALGRTAGAVIALDPRDGRLLAVVNPVYGVHHAYPPCSVFKVVVGLAGLAEGVVEPDTPLECDGGCWAWPGHGAVTLRRALAVSCNPYFQQVGRRLGWSAIRRYALELGLGARTGSGLQAEAPGVLPRSVVPSRVGITSSHARGIRMTPLQVATMLAATINGGIVYEPRLAARADHTPVVRRRLELPMHELVGGYYSAVAAGSAFAAFHPEPVVGGKTGTCSGVGWLASFAPVDDPEIVIVVFVRRGNGRRASTIAGKIYAELYPSAPQPLLGGE